MSPLPRHEELANILRSQGNRPMTRHELADAVNERGIYRKRDGSAVTDFQVHGSEPELQQAV